MGTGNTDIYMIDKLRITERIYLNKNTQMITKVSYYISQLFQKVYKDLYSYDGKTNFESIYTIHFLDIGDTIIDSQESIYDEAPDDLNEIFYYPTYELSNVTSGYLQTKIDKD